MSARRLQQPAPINVSDYKCLGTSIVTTLAAWPQPSGADLAYTFPHHLCELPPEQQNRRRKAIRLDGPPDRFLDKQNILAEFNKFHIPVFIQPEIWIKDPKVVAIQEILKAHEQGSEVKDLIKANFSQEDFPRHLITYLRDRARANSQGGSLETGLIDAYVTGLKEWCARALDIFISKAERDLGGHIESNEATDGQKADEITLWTQHFLLERSASYQTEALRSLLKKALRGNLKCHNEWLEYKGVHVVTHNGTPTSTMSVEKFYTTLMRKELRFISWLLRNSSSEFFLHEASDIAYTLKCFGGPCHLVNLIQNMSLYQEDMAEYTRLKMSVQGADDIDVQETSNPSVAGRLDLPKAIGYMGHPLHVLEPLWQSTYYSAYTLPPFLQLGYGLVDCNVEAINKVIKLFEGKQDDKALSVIDKDFHDAEKFHEQLFAYLRRAMRSYAFSPNLANATASYPHDFTTPLGKYLRKNVEGLQYWCSRAHELLTEKFDSAITAAYQSDTKESKDFIKAISDLELTYTQSVNWLANHAKCPLAIKLPPPSEIPLERHPQVADFRQSLYTLDRLIERMPWDCFLFFRANLANLVREVDGGKQGFSFLANVLESLSFADSDVEEFKRFCAEAWDLVRSRNERSEGL